MDLQGPSLFRFAQDKQPVQMNGDGFKGMWHSVKPRRPHENVPGSPAPTHWASVTRSAEAQRPTARARRECVRWITIPPKPEFALMHTFVARSEQRWLGRAFCVCLVIV
ncbi:COG4315 family predicted lipoprotein [Paraburkholderia nodosa]|uniref:hypothetical protein n=1 Tax=Paraburkholderia nodosa TaxID=392320 RepID=UPI001FE015FD|nr:hypothetical protein [Paraburkholderia nodosa]